MSTLRERAAAWMNDPMAENWNLASDTCWALGYREALEAVRAEVHPELRDMISRGKVIDIIGRLSK